MEIELQGHGSLLGVFGVAGDAAEEVLRPSLAFF
jgi:hypothetical protein